MYIIVLSYNEIITIYKNNIWFYMSLFLFIITQCYQKIKNNKRKNKSNNKSNNKTINNY